MHKIPDKAYSFPILPTITCTDPSKPYNLSMYKGMVKFSTATMHLLNAVNIKMTVECDDVRYVANLTLPYQSLQQLSTKEFNELCYYHFGNAAKELPYVQQIRTILRDHWQILEEQELPAFEYPQDEDWEPYKLTWPGVLKGYKSGFSKELVEQNMQNFWGSKFSPDDFIYKNDPGPSPKPGLSLSSKAATLPGVHTKVKHPITSRQTSIYSIIIDLNDDERWTREQIADWVETLDVDLRFKAPNDNDAQLL